MAKKFATSTVPKVQTFTTTDGRQFPRADEASAHQEWLDFADWYSDKENQLANTPAQLMYAWLKLKKPDICIMWGID